MSLSSRRPSSYLTPRRRRRARRRSPPASRLRALSLPGAREAAARLRRRPGLLRMLTPLQRLREEGACRLGASLASASRLRCSLWPCWPAVCGSSAPPRGTSGGRSEWRSCLLPVQTGWIRHRRRPSLSLVTTAMKSAQLQGSVSRRRCESLPRPSRAASPRQPCVPGRAGRRRSWHQRRRRLPARPGSPLHGRRRPAPDSFRRCVCPALRTPLSCILRQRLPRPLSP